MTIEEGYREMTSAVKAASYIMGHLGYENTARVMLHEAEMHERNLRNQGIEPIEVKNPFK